MDSATEVEHAHSGLEGNDHPHDHHDEQAADVIASKTEDAHEATSADQQQQHYDQQQQQQHYEQASPEVTSTGYKIDPSLASLADGAEGPDAENGDGQVPAAISGHDAAGLSSATDGVGATPAAGRYNPYPLPFHPQVSKDVDGSSDGSSQMGGPTTPAPQHIAGGPIRTHPQHHHHHHTPAGATPGTGRSGRHSVMLGNDGRPIPEHERPPVGTEEYANMRRVNHTEVEKKRRETINDGINALAAQLQKEYTTSEKNKGAILHKAAQYIEQLKQNEAINIERYTLEKLLCDQSIAELQQKCDQLQKEHDRAWKECELWRIAADGGPRPQGLQGPSLPSQEDEDAQSQSQQQQQQHQLHHQGHEQQHQQNQADEQNGATGDQAMVEAEDEEMTHDVDDDVVGDGDGSRPYTAIEQKV